MMSPAGWLAQGMALGMWMWWWLALGSCSRKLLAPGIWHQKEKMIGILAPGMAGKWNLNEYFCWLALGMWNFWRLALGSWNKKRMALGILALESEYLLALESECIAKLKIFSESWLLSMKKSYVSVLISVVKLELAAQNILKMMMDTG